MSHPTAMASRAGVLAAFLAAVAGFARGGTAGPVAEIVADARHGDDASGTGAAGSPFRTITRALASLAGARATSGAAATIRVRLGTYDKSLGERFPLHVPAGVRIEGHGSGVTILDGGDAAAVLDVSDPGGRIVLASLGLQGEGDGIDIRSRGGAALRVQLADIAAEVKGSGVVVWAGQDSAAATAAPPAVDLALAGSWFQGCREGLLVRGAAPAAVDVEECVFDACGNGILLTRGADVRLPQVLTVSRCRFVHCRGAGIRRESGPATGASGLACRVEDSTFLGNDIGMELPGPAGDAPFVLRRCAFLRNVHFGLKAVGEHGDPASRSLVEDSLFRWNGVGMHVVNLQVRFEARRNRITGNLGSGIFYANFIAEPGAAIFADCLVANNGAVGIHCLADNRVFQARIERCTVAGNDTSGIERKERHGGKGRFEIRGCIVAGNGADLVRIHEDEVSDTFVGDDKTFAGGAGNLTGDPGFVDPDARDYRLRADSPCLDRVDPGAAQGEGSSALPPPDASGPGVRPAAAVLLDLAGMPRAAGRIDLGCFERQQGG